MTGAQLRRRPRRTRRPRRRTTARRAEKALLDVYEANQLAQLDFETELDAAVLGDGVFKVTWDTAERRVRVSAPDVQGIFVWWLGDDTSRIWRVASRYTLLPEEVEMLYGVTPAKARGRAGGSEVVEVWTEQEFELWVDNVRIEQKANPYGFIPFVVYPNLREPKQFWGVSDVPAITRVGAGAEPRALAAFDDPGAFGQPDRRAGERRRVAGHRGAAGRGLGAAGAGARLPAGPAAGRRREAARRLRRPHLPHAARPGRSRRGRRSARTGRGYRAWR